MHAELCERPVIAPLTGRCVVHFYKMSCHRARLASCRAFNVPSEVYALLSRAVQTHDSDDLRFASHSFVSCQSGSNCAERGAPAACIPVVHPTVHPIAGSLRLGPHPIPTSRPSHRMHGNCGRHRGGRATCRCAGCPNKRTAAATISVLPNTCSD